MSSALLHPNRKTSNDASLPLLPHTTFQKRPSRMAPGDSCWTGDDSSWTSTVYTAFNQMCVSKPTRPIVKRASMPYEPTLQEEDQVDRLLTRASRSNSAPPLRLDVHQGGSDQYLLNSQMIHMLRMQLGAGQGDSSLKMRKFVAWRGEPPRFHHSGPITHSFRHSTLSSISTFLHGASTSIYHTSSIYFVSTATPFSRAKYLSVRREIRLVRGSV